MSVSNPYYEGVKVKRKATRAVKEVVSNGFFEQSLQTQIEWLERTAEVICNEYNIVCPEVSVADRNFYKPSSSFIGVTKGSMISMLHELRHHIQHKANKCYKGHNEEEDARAWSMRVFKLACPGSFRKSAKAGNIKHIKWVDGEVVNSRSV